MKKKIIIILIVVAINSSVLFTHALYRKNVEGNGSLRGATWSVSSTGNTNSITLTSGSTQTYTLTVNNGSELDVNYNIELTGLPDGVQVKLDSGNYVNPTSGVITFNNAGSLLYGGTTTRNHTLTFTSAIDHEELSNQTVSVNVDFIQDLS